MKRLFASLAVLASGFMAWSHVHPMVVGVVLCGAFGLLSDEAAKHPRLQGALQAMAAMGIDVMKLRDGLSMLLTGVAPSKDEVAVVQAAVDKVVGK